MVHHTGSFNDRPWYLKRQDREFAFNIESFLEFDKSYTKFNGCQIGPLYLSSAKRDEKVRTSKSYFLCELWHNEELLYRVARADGFIKHVAPGPEKREHTFILASFLLHPTPSHTTTSRLPLVITDNNLKHCVKDSDKADGLVSRLWRADAVEPSPVCSKFCNAPQCCMQEPQELTPPPPPPVVPADSRHDLPLTQNAEGKTDYDIYVPEASFSKDLQDTMATQYSPTGGLAGTAVLPNRGKHRHSRPDPKLGIVLCTFSETNERFRQS
jgi:hypothetical protein